MSFALVCCVAVTVGAAAPAVVLAIRGDTVNRLVAAMQLAAITTLVLLLFGQAVGNSSYLIVPLVLTVLSYAGALVFARLIVPRR